MGYIEKEAKNFAAMLRMYGSGKGYKTGWVLKMYKNKYPVNPLTDDEFLNSGKARPTLEFKQWIRKEHSRYFKSKNV